MQDTKSFAQDVRKHLDMLLYKDARRLGIELKRLINAEPQAKSKDEIALMLAEALQRAKLRKESVPKITYPQALPVSQHKDEIIKAIKEHQVVIVAGETGSGKTTQLPKMCLEAGLGQRGVIGHTQPRRIAARAVASRIAEELGQNLGQSVGYKVRFTDVTSENCLIKLMTDGILLSETASDRLLLQYDCIIIDEAHERSLNIDFLLGYLKNLLKRR
ncbi:MAG TPA: ATP-dependent RNA helicase HrpA, partial [Succinivibrionaceae bacterium]|nr:ATP-dependent RNA helicase HrpA [Succinivibrionaceae bacterium]